MSYQDFCGLVGGQVLILILAHVRRGPLLLDHGAHVHRVAAPVMARVVRHVRGLLFCLELVLPVEISGQWEQLVPMVGNSPLTSVDG